MSLSTCHDGFLEAKDSHPAKIVSRSSLEQGCNLKDQNNATATLKRSRLQGQLTKRVKPSDVGIQACGNRTANALCALIVDMNRRGRHDGSEGKR
jgi:hypothetical protein